ncbi:hypothetical protein CPB97_004834 [Podila verticillata]|nr:hypothetical protein CPB97_004834 [Podila verticillata]
MGFWSRSSAQAALSQEYQESVAHRVRDILTGVDHSAHNNRRDKNAIKALQRPEALAGVIEILKAMPEPECHINIDDDSDDDESRNHHQDLGGASANDVSSPVSGLAKNTTRPKATTVVAATTIAAAAATSAVAATLAVTIRKNKNKDARDTTDSTKPNGEIQMLDEDAETTTTAITKNTVVRFRPAVDTVSSCAYWWGYEIFIPQEALSRISSAQDVSSAFLGFLGSVGLVVPAIVPFLGYIAAYVGLEFAVIKAQNEGKGVILASTWLVPVALVPRAWDFVE